MSYSSAYNDFLSGSLIDRTNFRNLFGLLYFDLRNQDDVKDSVVSLTFRYQLTGNPAGNYTLNALVLHEKEIELYTSSGKLLIKAYINIISSHKMTPYLEYHVNLSDGQKANLAKAIKTGSELTLRLKNNQLRGNDELM